MSSTRPPNKTQDKAPAGQPESGIEERKDFNVLPFSKDKEAITKRKASHRSNKERV